MSQQARSEAKRLRRLKRKQDAGNGTVSKSISATGLTVVGGGTLAAIAIALGVNALSPGGQSDSNGDSAIAPIDSSQSPTPSVSAETDPSEDSVSEDSSSIKISATASPSSSPSASASPSTSPSPSQSPGIQQGVYYDAGRYGSGHYSTAYNVAFSSPMFMAGSGSYYGLSGYDSAINSPSGYYSRGGWSGSGFYESGYFDLSGNTGYYDLSGSFIYSMGSWDGSGITHQYGAGAYYGVSGFSDAQYQPNGSYFSTGHFGSGYYTSFYFDYSPGNNSVASGSGSYYGISGLTEPIDSPSGYRSITGYYGLGYYESGYYDIGYTGSTNHWNGQPQGTGAYYGISGYSDPIYAPNGSYYASGFAGAGHYASSISYEYYRVSGNWVSYNLTTAVMGDGTYYGASGTSEPIPGLSGSYYSLGVFGAGYYSTGYYSCGFMQSQPTGATEWNYYASQIGRQTYYGFSPNASPINGPEGTPKNDGFAGTGYYEPGSIYDSPWMYGTGTYYGTNGYGSPVAPPPGSWYSSGNYGSGYYAESGYDPNWGGIGTGTYYGVSGNSPPLEPT